MGKLFVYNELNTHELQRDLWKEAKEGEALRLDDWELMVGEQGFYVKRRPGETVIGKVYDLNDKQLKKTDKYMGKGMKRVTIRHDGTSIELYTLKVKGKKK